MLEGLEVPVCTEAGPLARHSCGFKKVIYVQEEAPQEHLFCCTVPPLAKQVPLQPTKHLPFIPACDSALWEGLAGGWRRDRQL